MWFNFHLAFSNLTEQTLAQQQPAALHQHHILVADCFEPSFPFKVNSIRYNNSNWIYVFIRLFGLGDESQETEAEKKVHRIIEER